MEDEQDGEANSWNGITEIMILLAFLLNQVLNWHFKYLFYIWNAFVLAA